MHYEREDLGFSFDLPDGWRHDEHNLTLSFYGPRGGLGVMSELIQISIATILPQYQTPSSREQFLAEPGAEVSRSRVGSEENVVVLRRVRDSEISVVRDGVQYTIMHFHDTASEAAIDHLKRTAQFGSPDRVQTAIRSWSNPRAQAVSKVLRAGSPEEARDILASAGMPGHRITGGTFHDLSDRDGVRSQPEEKGCMPAVMLLAIIVLAVLAFVWR